MALPFSAFLELKNTLFGVSIWELVVAFGMKREWRTHQRSLHLSPVSYNLLGRGFAAWSRSCYTVKSKCILPWGLRMHFELRQPWTSMLRAARPCTCTHPRGGQQKGLAAAPGQGAAVWPSRSSRGRMDSVLQRFWNPGV